MPVGYVITTVLAAALTAMAVAAPPRPPLLKSVDFFTGLVVNELPNVVVAWLAAATAVAAVQGELLTPVGIVGLALAIGTCAGLVVIAGRGIATKPALDAALQAGLGPGWRQAIDPELASGLRRRFPWASIVLLPFRVRRFDVIRVKDLRYGHAGERNLLDVFHHRRRDPVSDRPAPVLIHVHGGSFRSGHKNRETRPLLYRLASQGWICISANYRLLPESRWPDHLVDLKLVIDWARANADRFGIDPSQVYVAGSSAGGHLAAMAALTQNDPAFQPGFEDADTSVAGAIGLYGFYGPLDAGGPDSSPVTHVGRPAPPMMIVHGDRDSVVSVANARRFVSALGAAGTDDVVFAELPGANHGFDLFHSVRFERVVDAVEAFTAWVRSTSDRDGRSPRSGVGGG